MSTPQLSIETKIYKIENLLNNTIGTSYYKRYIGAIFWNNISTPINLAITLMSAVNTGQATTGNLISDNTFLKLSIATLILTSINTFFRPSEQVNINNEYSRKWIDFGTKFEEIYLSDKVPEDKYKAYYKLNQDIHSFENTQTINQNCFIDVIYKIVSITCLNGKQTWFKVSNGDDENIHKVDIETGKCKEMDTTKTDTTKTDTTEKVEEKPIPVTIPDTPYSVIYPERAFVTCMMDDIPQPGTAKRPKSEILQEIEATKLRIMELNAKLQYMKSQHETVLQEVLCITSCIEHENMTYDKKMKMEEQKKVQETNLQELSNIIKEIEQEMKNMENHVKDSEKQIQPSTPPLEPSISNISSKKIEWEEKLYDNTNRFMVERNIMFREVPNKENKDAIE